MDVYKKSSLNKENYNGTQLKVLCTWIVELQLSKINEIKARTLPPVKDPSKMTDDEKIH